MPTIQRKQLTTRPERISDQERKAIYATRRWRKLRDAHLSANPLCASCLRQGAIRPATEVHHLRSFMDYVGDERVRVAYDPDNLESICKSCHGREHSLGSASVHTT